jgi:hypothetical protein
LNEEEELNMPAEDGDFVPAWDDGEERDVCVKGEGRE